MDSAMGICIDTLRCGEPSNRPYLIVIFSISPRGNRFQWKMKGREMCRGTVRQSAFHAKKRIGGRNSRYRCYCTQVMSVVMIALISYIWSSLLLRATVHDPNSKLFEFAVIGHLTKNTRQMILSSSWSG